MGKNRFVDQTTHIDPSNAYVALIDVSDRSEFNNNTHYHGFYELEMVVSGEGSYEINNVVYPIQPGMLFLTTPADYHTYSLPPGGRAQMHSLQFFSELLSEQITSRLYAYVKPIALQFEGAALEDVTGRLMRMHEIFREKAPMYELMLKNEVENLCILLIRQMDRENAAPDGASVIRRAVIYVKDQYRGRITLESAAEHVGLSAKYFSHLFATTMGIGFANYVRQVRLDAAANLIKATDLPFKEVCYRTGFANQNYFTDVFRDRFGVAPRIYRENYRRHRVAPAESPSCAAF